jgi:cardiolipin synthase
MAQVISIGEAADREPDVWPVTVGDHVFELFCESGPLFEAMVDDIAKAEHRVWLETYIFADDGAGRPIAEALMERARAGLDVHFLYDAWGCWQVPDALLEEMANSGVQVHPFHSLNDAVLHPNFFTFFNRRNHRKLLVVDDRVAYFGGMNVVDTAGVHTLDDARQRNLPASAGWRDVHARVGGPIVEEIAAAHERLWTRVHRQRGQKKRWPKLRWPKWPVQKMLADSGDGVYVFDCLPSKKARHAKRVLCPLIRQAKSNITVAMAYFLPMGSVLRELIRARKRGVKIRVIVPGKSDVPIVQWAARHLYAWLIRRGIVLYERNDLMLHSKVMAIDDRWSVIGSCNLDPRSLQLNLEFIGVVRSRAMNEAIREICAREMQNSRRATLAQWRGRTWWQRLRDRIAWSLRRWL